MECSFLTLCQSVPSNMIRDRYLRPSCTLFQAVGFLVSSNRHSAAEETELDDRVYSNGDYADNDYADTASLLEQVIVCSVKYFFI